MTAGAGVGPRPWGYGALALLCLALFLPGFFTLPPFDRDEARFAQASRQMVESGDYIDIRFQDEQRLKKPVGIYWLQAASLRLFGSVDSAEIWPYRLPSLLGAILAVLATAWTGGRLFGASAGLLGAAMLACCVLLGAEARLAKTDAVLLLTIVLAQGALARIWLDREREEPPGLPMPLLFWFALGTGILIKGPVGPMVSGLTILGLALAERRAGWLRRLRPWLGLAVVLAVAAPWLVAIAIKTDGRFFAESLGHDLAAKIGSGQEGKGSPPGSYLLAFWFSFAPFALPAALAAPWVWRNRRDPAVLFCLAWLLPSWLVFEAVPSKLFHYVLPTFPAIALLTARAAEAGFERRRGFFIAASVLAGLAVLTLAGMAELLPWFFDRRLPVAPVVVATLVAVLFAAAVLLLWRGRNRPAFGLLAAGFVLWSGVAFGVVLPGLQGLWLSREIAERVAVLRPCPESTLASGGYAEPSLVFLLGTQTKLGRGDTAARNLAIDPACGLALVDREEEALFRQTLRGQAVKPLATIEGFNYSRGKLQTLTLYAAER